MDANRRTFLQLAGLASAAPVAAVGALQPASGDVPPELTRAAFEALRGERFVFETQPPQTVEAKLVGVEPLPQAGNPEASFRLEFAVEAGSLPQRTFSVTHPRLGRFALFVSPNDAAGRVVEAIFNRV